MILLGLTGPIGHGKTTFSHMLGRLEPTSQHAESWLVIREVVEAMNKHLRASAIPEIDDLSAVNAWLSHLPEVLDKVTGRSYSLTQVEIKPADVLEHIEAYEKMWDYLNLVRKQPELLEQDIVQENKETFRPILQWFGGYLVKKLDTGIWFNELVRRAEKAERQGCQLYIISGMRFPSEGAIMHAAGAKVIRIVRPGAEVRDTADPTERERDRIVVDTTVLNNGNLTDLGAAAERVLADVRSGSLREEYSAAQPA